MQPCITPYNFPLQVENESPAPKVGARLSNTLVSARLVDVLRAVLLAFITVTFALPAAAQTVRVDSTLSHSTNSIKPTEALGAAIDRLPYGAVDKLFNDDMVKQVLASGWQTVSYRQNTELHIEAWHWNPQGTWSDPSGKGYFTGSATPGPMLRHSYGYPLPHRGVTHDDGTDYVGYSRLTDGDPATYWKSNPYLTKAFTGEEDSLHPQWILMDLASFQPVNAIRIAWAEPYAVHYLVQYWTGADTFDPIKHPTAGVWHTFPGGTLTDGRGGAVVLALSAVPIPVQFIRILMTESSNTCDTHGASDRRNCVGYAIRELYLGTTTADGQFHDLVRHTPDQDQTATYCSSVDPWHQSSDLDEKAGDQVGFDLFFTGGFTRGLPAMIPIAMLYGTPEDSAAEIAYIEKRGYPISYVEMGEEPDGHYTNPEDYAALYIQWAAALHKVDPGLKLGGPIFTGVNKDIETWPDASGHASWTARFIDYLKSHGHLNDLAFFSYEHYPMEPCKIQWSNLYDEPTLVSNMLNIWRQDGVPAEVPQFITESNITWQSGESFVDVWGALWLADYVGAYLSAGGRGVYYFHYMPLGVHHDGCNSSGGTFGFLSTDTDLHAKQPLSQFFASQLINLEWVQPGDKVHKLFPVESDIRDSAGHLLVTVYAALRPDGQWSLMIINKDQENPHPVHVVFHDAEKNTDSSFAGPVSVVTFGSEQYQWHPAADGGVADPDGPAVRTTITASGTASSGTVFTLPKASISVLRGSISTAERSAVK
ncbi:MAG: discoidin domain-containing protein [Candidatus Acidiferrales bacterium]